MNKYLIYLFCTAILFLSGCNSAGNSGEDANSEEKSSTPESGSYAEILFVEKVKDLGKIEQGEKVATWYEYVNSSNNPLIINRIHAGCGCTVPSWNEEPVAPGDSGTIKVIFDSGGKHGVQNIKISVYVNTEEQREILNLKAIVE